MHSIPRRPRLVLFLALAALAVLAIAVDAVEITFHNHCDKQMTLSDGKKLRQKINVNASVSHTLRPLDIRAYRYGPGNEATLAEFSVDKDAMTWYDIGIIPTGPKGGPGTCTSLTHCTEVTGGTGFNVPVKIIPHADDTVGDHCATLVCLENGCPGAYHFPNDNSKTHNCPPNVKFSVVFCATNRTGSSEASLSNSGSDASSSSRDTGSAVVQSKETSKPSSSPVSSIQSVTSGTDAKDESTAVAVYVASIVGGFILVFASVILIRRYRHKRLEDMNGFRYSSEAVMFVDARDEAVI